MTADTTRPADGVPGRPAGDDGTWAATLEAMSEALSTFSETLAHLAAQLRQQASRA